MTFRFRFEPNRIFFVLLAIAVVVGCHSTQPNPKASPSVVTTLEKSVNEVLFNSQGILAISESEGDRIFLWEIAPPKLLRTLQVSSTNVADIAFSPDGKKLVSTSYSTDSETSPVPIELWDVNRTTPSKKLEAKSTIVTNLDFSLAPEALIVGKIDGAIDVWDLKTGKIDRTIQTNLPINDLAIAPDDSTIIVNGSTSPDVASLYKTIKLWDLKTGKAIRTLQEHQDLVRDMTFSPDGSKIAIAAESFVTLWDVSNGKSLYTLQGHLDEVPAEPQDNGVTIKLGVRSIAFSPDGKIIATGSQDNTIKIWDVNSGKELYTLRGHSCSVNSVAFSPDGQILASGSSDRAVKLWKVSDFPNFSAAGVPDKPIDPIDCI